MQGQVLDYSIQTNTGVISANDGKRYKFVGSEWQVATTPKRGMVVDFDVNELGQAVEIYQALGRSSNTPKTTRKTNHNYDYDDLDILEIEEDYNPLDWFMKCLRNYANFDGRARRKEYWFFILGYTILFFGGALLDYALFHDWTDEVEYYLTQDESSYEMYIMITVWVALLIPSIAVGSRRLHDTGKTGWIQLVMLVIPILGHIAIFILCTLDGDPDENQYGEPTK